MFNKEYRFHLHGKYSYIEVVIDRQDKDLAESDHWYGTKVNGLIYIFRPKYMGVHKVNGVKKPKYTNVYLHREILQRKYPDVNLKGLDTDHIKTDDTRVRWDNRRSNLRALPRSLNSVNRQFGLHKNYLIIDGGGHSRNVQQTKVRVLGKAFSLNKYLSKKDRGIEALRYIAVVGYLCLYGDLVLDTLLEIQHIPKNKIKTLKKLLIKDGNYGLQMRYLKNNPVVFKDAQEKIPALHDKQIEIIGRIGSAIASYRYIMP